MAARLLGIAFVTGFLAAAAVGPAAIPLLRRLKFGQAIRDEGPAWHAGKAGTPTMGGVIFIVAALFGAFLLAMPSAELYLVAFAFLGSGVIGGLDDGIKIALRRNLGLTPLQKLAAQGLLAAVFFRQYVATGFSTALETYAFGRVELGAAYFFVVLLLFLSATNAVNLTDGLDGLAAGAMLLASAAYAVLAWYGSRFDLAIFNAALAGALGGFLLYNAHPARVFMGDTGSLALGGALAASALLTKTELLLVWLGGLFVIEALSVILQVASFKLRGRRIFRMSPLHHHFELVGWSEWQVVLAFWAAEAVLAFSAVAWAIGR
ncbi:phospho-N-acetylmuramoyl-pentapeptide-transferase [Hydrogenibacillus schlegelii]|nr:phospho-N-acetylmuramoyl-pentapeptide-transferase [Hydrogenibacillus schlegelii]